MLIFLTIFFPVILGYFLNHYLNMKYISIPLHSGFEVSGGVIAVVISMIFYFKYSKKHLFTQYNWITVALLTMGIIDIFHGIVMPGKLFVWLHSIAVFLGGILFITVWINNKIVSKKIYKLMPLLVSFFAIIVSILSIVFIDYIPEMINEDKTFTITADLLNFMGGVGFFIASFKFLFDYIKKQNINDYLFAGHTLLFGIAGILFVSSEIWDLQWWLWHLLRLSAYIIALHYLYIEFREEIKLIEKTNNKLNKANKEIKKYISLVDEHVILSSTDLQGNINYVSKAFCKISGYSKKELLGRNHSLLRDEKMSKEFYEDLWKTILLNKTWRGEIKNRKKDGTSYWIKASIFPIFNSYGKKIGYSSIKEDISDKKIIEKISITDPLTGLYNRRYLENILPGLLNSLKRENNFFSFLMIDIDFFKQYNDTYGHNKGDKVLKKVANTLRNTLKRKDDYYFRLGGEEFAIIFKSKTLENAVQFSQSLKNSIENLNIEHKNSKISDKITISLGLVCKASKEVKSFEDIYKEADLLLYKAKNSGRNKVVSNL